ncbi:alpha/beta fold hydrolase [Lysobacter auxotrophicus]|uniref:Alpha/beta hydrolase n=1 Tax=Lysobacter auxotrophicus TaxID=2992573 RepID=A0ABN6UQZ2_9GAMM|nr:alpha/beta hydrolase [Lysobacter auxotrophicus]BDU18270.1 alpha/beta hydrolase [Lysobacter auxotrophicus]
MKSIARIALIAGASMFAPAHAAPDAPPQTPDTYATAGQRVTIAPGRALNLRCVGDGPRTVLLEAGGNADSTTWFKVLAMLAPQTRTCAYDRAGYGFSDEGPMPRDLDADVADLAALITAAGLKTPLVLVGHSLGSNIVRRYAQHHPENVRALVLVDPPEQGVDALLPAAWKQQGEAGRSQRDAFLDACLKAAEAGTLDKAEGPLASCLRAAPPWQSASVAAASRAYKLKPAYWRTLRSELDANTAIFAAPVPADESHGATPVVVLTAPNDVPGVPDEVRKALQTAREQTQARLAATSTNGRVVAVPNASHDIQIDAPQAVADAVNELWSR